MIGGELDVERLEKEAFKDIDKKFYVFRFDF